MVHQQVPALTVIIGASFGAGNYAMNGRCVSLLRFDSSLLICRAYKARFHFAWPGSKVAVMGSEQLVGVMTTIRYDGYRILAPVASLEQP